MARRGDRPCRHQPRANATTLRRLTPARSATTPAVPNSTTRAGSKVGHPLRRWLVVAALGLSLAFLAFYVPWLPLGITIALLIMDGLLVWGIVRNRLKVQQAPWARVFALLLVVILIG